MTDLKYVAFNLRPATPLTNAYVASKVVDISTSFNPSTDNQLNLYVHVKRNTITTISMFIEFSADKVNWYQETLDETTVGSGAVTERLADREFGVDGNYRISIPIKDQYYRIQAKGNISDGASSFKVDVIEGTA